MSHKIRLAKRSTESCVTLACTCMTRILGGSLQQFRNTLFGIIILLPELKLFIGRSRQLEKGWDKSVPSHSPPPVSLTTVNFLCALLTTLGKFQELLALNMGFHGFLLANDICKPRFSDVCFPGDLRLSDFRNSRAACVVRHAKTGNKSICVHLRFRASAQPRTFHPTTAIKPWVSASSLLLVAYSCLQRCASLLSAKKLATICTPFIMKELPLSGLVCKRLEDIMLKGQWSSKKSYKHYINARKLLLFRTKLPHQSSKLLMAYVSRWDLTAVEVRWIGPKIIIILAPLWL